MADEKPGDPPSEGFDSVVLIEDAHESDGEDYGLELDAAQSGEIRGVFLATLPEYLEPVEQMVEQLAHGSGGDDTLKALRTTLNSISDAAVRIGIDDVARRLEKVCGHLDMLGDELLPLEDALAGVRGEIEQIKALQGTAGQQPGMRAKKTIFAALQNVEGIDRSVLEPLTAAGLVTVDQLRVAKVHEIVAVTGLAEEVVASLVAALVGDARGPRSQPHGLDAVRSPPQEPDGLDAFLEAGAFASEDNETEGPDPEVPLLPTPRVHAGPRQDHEGGETLASKDALRAKLRRQVESEAALERIRCDVLRLKARTAGLRTDVGSARSRRDDMAKELDRLRSHLATRLAHLRELRQTTDARRQGLGDTSAKLEEAQARLNALQSRHRAATEERARFGQSVAELVQTLERMLKSRPADRPSAANDPDAP